MNRYQQQQHQQQQQQRNRNGISSNGNTTANSRRLVDVEDDTINAKPLQAPARSVTAATANNDNANANTKPQHTLSQQQQQQSQTSSTNTASTTTGIAMIRPPTFSSVAARRSSSNNHFNGTESSSCSDDDHNEQYLHGYDQHIAKIATTPSINPSTTEADNNGMPQQRPQPTTTAVAAMNLTMPSSNASQSTTSTPMPPPLPPIGREQSTPGAVAVTGVFTNPRTRDYDQNEFSDWETIATRSSLPSTVGVPRNNPNNNNNNNTNNTTTTTNNIAATTDNNNNHTSNIPAIVAELAPDEGDVAARVAERISAEMTERLKREVQQQLMEQHHHLRPVSNSAQIPIVAAERMFQQQEEEQSRRRNGNSTSRNRRRRRKSSSSQDSNDSSNFKICGVRRSCWGIWMVFVLFLAIGAGTGIVLYQKGLFGDTGDKEPLPNTTTTATDSPQEPPPPVLQRTPSPTGAPTPASRRDNFLTILAPYILPQSETALEESNTPQFLALDWLVNIDEYFDNDRLDDILNDNNDGDNIFRRQIVERYALVVLFYTNGITGNTIEPKTNWNLRFNRNFAKIHHCHWNTHSNNPLITESNNQDNISQGIFCGNDFTNNANNNDNNNNNNDQGNNDEAEDDPSSLRVTELHLANFGFQGPLPWELSFMDQLKHCDMDHNSFHGTLPLEYFRDWSLLETLWMASNELSGSLPGALRRLTNLQSLDFQENSFGGTLPTDWGLRLSNLFFVRLGLNRIGGSLPASWGRGSIRSSLRIWDLEGNQLTGSIPTEYGLLTKLEFFFLESNKGITGTLPTELGQLESLQQLFVFNNQLTGSIPTSFAALKNQLDFFWFQGNQLTGSVDEIFCSSNGSTSSINLIGDCLGDTPEITCSCCTSCCSGSIQNQTCMAT